MSEKPPIQNNFESRSLIEESTEKDRAIERRDALALELFESGEVFPFPGILPESYEHLLEAEKFAPPGYVTPIDELIEKFTREGMKVEKGISWKTGSNIECVAPASSDGGLYGEDLLHLKNLQIPANMDPKLAELVMLSKI
jgi:hypothetical protein